MINFEQKLAFDIGCNKGEYTKALLKAGYNKIVAVDPNPTLFIPKEKEVIRIYSACSEVKGTIPFFIASVDTISSASIDWVQESRFSKSFQWIPTMVTSITLDNLIEEYGVPEHIKIDVEGYEEVVLKGMTKKYSPVICFEWAEELGDSSVRCVKYLASLGYTKFGFIYSDEYLKEPDVYYTLEEFIDHFNYDKERKLLWGMIWAK